jgi:hypothetical protein
MKKLTALLLAVMFVMTMSTTAFAAGGTIDTAGGSQTIDVSAKYTDNTSTQTVYNVDLTWEAMSFTYTAAGTKTWNPNTHSYTDSTTGSWSNGKTITVTNHSNATVTADFAYLASTNFTAATSNFTATTLSLATAENTTLATAPTASTTFSLGGTLPSTQTASVKIGTITVTLN